MKTKTSVIAVIAVIVLAAAAASGYLLTSSPQAKAYTLDVKDYGYNGKAFGPTLTVKAGETVTVTLVGDSGNKFGHEFRLSANKDKFISDTNKAIADLQAQGMKTAEQVDNASAFKDARRLTGMKIVMVDNTPDWDVDVGPGEKVTIHFTIDTPGTYWYVCGELDGTFPQTHAGHDMFGQIVVER